MKHNIKNLTLAAMFLAIGLVLPFLTGQIPRIGNMLLPMHIPVFLCGLICGWQYGGAVGFVLPLLRAALFGAPVFFPTATAMACELMTYGLVAGLLYSCSRWQCIRALYRSLIAAMLAGRAVWGVVQMIQLGAAGSGFGWQMFLAGAFLNAVPGIVLQLILIPALMLALHRTGLVPFHKRDAQRCKPCRRTARPGSSRWTDGAPREKPRWRRVCSSGAGAMWCIWTTFSCARPSGPRRVCGSRAGTWTGSASSRRCCVRCGAGRAAPTARTIAAHRDGSRLFASSRRRSRLSRVHTAAIPTCGIYMTCICS